jgi:RND family efflux transporter MFP subunit
MIALLLVAAVAGWGIFARLSAAAALERSTAEQLIPVVSTVIAKSVAGDEDLALPGSVMPIVEAPIYARTSGYVKFWKTDIGAKVAKGDLLAELETPEVDQQLRQAEADSATAAANEALARNSAKRWQALLKTDSVSRQENDEKQADAAAKLAALNSAKANLDRLRELQSFKRVVAPFAGVVTARMTDVGALINSGAANGAALFRVADVSRVRIYVQVPENVAMMIHPGVKVELTLAVAPGRKFEAEVVHTADALDSASRSLQVEIQADNSRHEILTGGYAKVHFNLPLAAGKPRVPISSLIFRGSGAQLAVLDSTLHAHLVPITLGRDFGTQFEVAAGLKEGDQVILSPPDSLSDGDLVRLAAAKAAP